MGDTSALAALVQGARKDGASEPVVTDMERHTHLWKKIRAHAELRLASLRVKNDNALGEVATAKLRGKIAELKYLLALENPAPTMGADDTE